MTQLPWTIPFLKIVHNEYSKSPPKYKNEKVLDSDIEYILKTASEDDPFDKGGLKKESVLEIQSKRADILKSTCEYGEILVVSFKNSPIELHWNTWWRAVRLLSPNHQVRILIFGHPRKRVLPSESIPIGPEHLNGGAAMRCDSETIVIYRSEEVTRVLLHELFHASCSDPYTKDTPHIEADTEAWAEILLCAMAAKGNPQAWNRYMHEQINWALKQASAIQSKYNIKSPEDYAWRYIIGRLEVWKSLGIKISTTNVIKHYKLSTLRFTICEPKNV